MRFETSRFILFLRPGLLNGHTQNNRMKQSSASYLLLEWMCRIFFSLDLVLPGLNNNNSHFYPLDALLLTLVGFWLYLFRLKSIACILLVSASLVSYQHFQTT
jgi:hypothetical protein